MISLKSFWHAEDFMQLSWEIKKEVWRNSGVFFRPSLLEKQCKHPVYQEKDNYTALLRSIIKKLSRLISKLEVYTQKSECSNEFCRWPVMLLHDDEGMVVAATFLFLVEMQFPLKYYQLIKKSSIFTEREISVVMILEDPLKQLENSSQVFASVHTVPKLWLITLNKKNIKTSAFFSANRSMEENGAWHQMMLKQCRHLYVAAILVPSSHVSIPKKKHSQTYPSSKLCFSWKN